MMERKRRSISDEEDQEKSATQHPKRRWKKPRDKPKRPLSAYNLFFQHERNMIVTGDVTGDKNAAKQDSTTSAYEKNGKSDVKPHGKIGFHSLTKRVASRWKDLDPKRKKIFEDQALIEKERYRLELAVWKDERSKQTANTAGKSGDSFPDRNTSDIVDSVRWDYNAPPADSIEDFIRRSGYVSTSISTSSSASMPVLETDTDIDQEDNDSSYHNAYLLRPLNVGVQSLPNAPQAAALSEQPDAVLSAAAATQAGSVYMGNGPCAIRSSDPIAPLDQAQVPAESVLQESKEGSPTLLRRQHVAGIYSRLGDLSANIDDESFEMLTDLFKPPG